MKVGTDQVEKVVDLIAQVGNVVDKAAHTEGNVVKRLTALVGLSSELVAISGVDFQKLKEQIQDLDDAERVSLLERFKGKFDLPNDKLEGHIEEALSIALEQEKLVERAVALAKSLKAPSEAPQA